MSKFLDELVNEVQQLLGNKVVCAKKVIRKNNVSKDAIVIFSNGNKIGKIIYVDEKETTAAEVVELFNRKEDEKPVFDIEKNLLNWNCVKEKSNFVLQQMKIMLLALYTECMQICM